LLKAIERLIKRPIEPIEIEGFEPPAFDPNAEKEIERPAFARKNSRPRNNSSASAGRRRSPKAAKSAPGRTSNRPARSSGTAPRNASTTAPRNQQG